MPSRQRRCCAGVEPLLFARHASKNPPPSPSRRASALAEGFPFGGPMHVYSGALLLRQVQSPQASCATCRGIAASPRAPWPAHRRFRKSSYALRPCAETSANTAFFSPLEFSLPDSVPIASVSIQGVIPPNTAYNPTFELGRFNLFLLDTAPGEQQNCAIRGSSLKKDSSPTFCPLLGWACRPGAFIQSVPRAII